MTGHHGLTGVQGGMAQNRKARKRIAEWFKTNYDDVSA